MKQDSKNLLKKKGTFQVPFFYNKDMKKFIISLFFTLILSCSSQDSLDVNSANEQGILLLDNGTEPQGLDPHIVTGVT